MYASETKTFHCDNCGKQVVSGENVWTKWNFPPKVTAAQMKAIKELEFQNAPIICQTCSEELLSKSF
ncbi:hypothetical protein BAU15_06485 [Enterococcus sp. JM4C]|nr:hypothetical protein BAU15_06485 [Enterococcus sp. JM4C]